MPEPRDRIPIERASRSWVAFDAATRVLNRRSRLAHPFDIWYRAFRREPIGRVTLTLGLFFLVIASMWLFMQLVGARGARLVAAAGAPTPSIIVSEAVKFVLLIAVFCVINLILLRLIRPRRTARVLEARRLRRCDRLASQLVESSEGRRIATAAVMELRRAAGARGDRLSVNSIWQGLIGTSSAYVASQWIGVAFMMIGHVAVGFVSRSGFVGPFRSLSMICVIAALWIVVLGVRVPIRRIRKRLLAALTDRACPECGYDLRSLTEVADPIIAALGPRACPECGVRWPLVPPRLGG